MRKIIVIGSPGAGKSTFARELRDITGIPLYYLDMIWHKPDRTNVAADKFDARLGEILKKDRWIIDGNYLRTLEIRLKECDTVFLLDYPPDVCLSGAKSRIGKKREDMPWIETEFDDEFRQWIIDFPKDQLPQIYRLLNFYRDGRNISVLKSRKEADEILKTERTIMNRQKIFKWVKATYGTAPDYPWNDKNAVLRHNDNNKWYGVVIEVTESKLGLPGDKITDVLNVKCDPLLIGSLRQQKGYFPAYHMNKESWISILLDGSVPEEEIKNLIELSYNLTKNRKK